jgi:hypothetical protein
MHTLTKVLNKLIFLIFIGQSFLMIGQANCFTQPLNGGIVTPNASVTTCAPQYCATLTGQVIREIRDTNVYGVSAIPHNPPLPYTTTLGTPIFINADDRWSDIINLSFNFYYYGQCYSQVRVGANGALRLVGNGFDVAIHPADPKKRYIPEIILTEALRGSNYQKEKEDTKAGTNGVGAKLTNAHSLMFSVDNGMYLTNSPFICGS